MQRLSIIAIAMASLVLCTGATPTKKIDAIRAECQAENPPNRGGDRGTVISRCIDRKKQEQGVK